MALAEQNLVSSLVQAVPSSRSFTLEGGETLYREGETPESVYAVTTGLVKLVSYLPDGRSRIVRLLGADSVVGFDGLVNDTHPHTAIAVNRVTGFRIPLAPLERLRTESAELHDALLTRLHQHLQYADTWITQFSTGPVKARVARLVEFLTTVEDNTGDDEVQLLTCEEMADILGVTPESVSRVLAEFKRNDILTPADGASDLYEKDRDGLQKVADDH